MNSNYTPLRKTFGRRDFNRQKSIRCSSGFTIVELLVIIVVIGILAGMSVVGYNSIQVSSRDEQRKTNATALAAALEKYYARNSEYPSRPSLVGQTATAVKNKLGLSNVSILRMPGGADNSLSATVTPTTMVYRSTDIDSSCSNLIGGCSSFILEWRVEKTGTNTTLTSNY